MLGSEKNTFSQSNTRSLGCQTFVKVFVNLSICLRYKYFTGWDLAVTIRKHLRQQKSEKKHLSNHRELHNMMILYHISLTFVWFMNFYVFFFTQNMHVELFGFHKVGDTDSVTGQQLNQMRKMKIEFFTFLLIIWHTFCYWPTISIKIFSFQSNMQTKTFTSPLGHTCICIFIETIKSWVF